MPSITATAEFVVPKSIPIMGPFTLPLSAFVSSAYPLLNCDVIGARYADDLKVEVARGTAYIDVSVAARVMVFDGALNSHSASVWRKAWLRY